MVATFDGFRVKDRSGKVNRRLTRMPEDNRGSIATIQRVIAKRGRIASAKLAGRSK